MVGLLAQKLVEAGFSEPAENMVKDQANKQVAKKPKHRKTKRKNLKGKKLRILPADYKERRSYSKKRRVRDFYKRRLTRRSLLKTKHLHAWLVYRNSEVTPIGNLTSRTLDQLFSKFLHLEESDAEKLADLYDEEIHSLTAQVERGATARNIQAGSIKKKLEDLDPVLLNEHLIKGLHLCSAEQVREIAETGLKLLASAPSDKAKLIEKFLNRLKKQLIPRGKSFWEEVGYKDWFRWPTTDLIEGISRSSLEDVNWETEGPLSVMGYRVGLSSDLSEMKRREILSYAFEANIDRLKTGLEQEWGAPCSTKRLQKIALSLAQFTKNAKGKSGDYRQAISDWENDLDFLYDKYYIGFFNFS